MWDEDVFPGASLDDLSEAVTFLALPPISGAAPGIFDEFANAFSWAKGSVFDPVGAAVTGFASEIVKYATQAIAGFFSILGWWMYKFFDDLIGSPTSISWRSLFPHPDIVKGLSPWYYLHKVWTMVLVRTQHQITDTADWLWGLAGTWFGWTIGEVRAGANWLWSQISAGFAAAANLPAAAAAWLWGLAGTWFGWTIGEVRHAADWLWSQTSAVFTSVTTFVGDAADWLWTNVSAGFTEVKNAVTGAVIAGGQAIGDVISDAFRSILLGPIDALVDTANAKLAIPGKMFRGEYDSLEELWDDISDPLPALLAAIPGVLIIGFVIALIASNLITTLMNPLLEPLVQRERAKIGAELLPPATLQEAWLRGFIDESTVDGHLSRAGYKGESLNALKELRHRLPTPSDLVRFGVREVFTPEIAERFGQFQDFPPRFGDEMEKQGYTDEWSQAYWAAHWELPSVSAGYEMLHRGVIDLDTLMVLLRAQDVMPFWRQPLVDIAYNLPTRVDTRRLLKAGIWTEAQVYQNYLALGNLPEVARALTDFAIKWATPEDAMEIDDITDVATSEIRLAYRRHVVDRARALDMLVTSGVTAELAEFYLSVDDTRLARDPAADADVDVRELTLSVILDAYSEGLWDRDRTQRELESAGFLPTSADLLLTLEDYKIGRALTAAQVGLIRQQYISYDLDDAGAGQALQLLEISPGRQALTLAEWSVDRQAGTRKLSVAEIRTAWRAGRFSDDDALAYLLRLGYNADDAELIFASW